MQVGFHGGVVSEHRSIRLALPLLKLWIYSPEVGGCDEITVFAIGVCASCRWPFLLWGSVGSGDCNHLGYAAALPPGRLAAIRDQAVA